MSKGLALALAVAALAVAAAVGFLVFGGSAPPASAVVPPSSGAVATPDGSEIAHAPQP